MVVIHRIFRRGFAQLADLARRVPAHDTAWAGAVAAHAEFLLDGLHHHHTAEDEHLWPLLLDRTRPDALLVARMEDQHAVVAQHVARVRQLLPGWRAAPSGAELAVGFDELGVALAQHLDEEEAEILPLVRAYVTVAEWQDIGDAAFAKFSNGEKLIALGQMLDVASPEEATGFLAKLPLPIRLMWRLAGRRRYARYMETVSHTAG
jgi:hemerythrin-like domain-containing protein